MRYTDLVFDLYGTLVDIHTEESDAVWEKTAVYFGFYGAFYTGPELKKAFHAVMAEQEAAAGQSCECFPDIPFELSFAQLFRQKGVKEHADALGIHAAQLFRITSLDDLRLYPHVREALTTLRSHGFRLWLLTNAQRIFTAYELRYLGLDNMFDGIYISSDYRCRKPDRRFFQALIQQHGLTPSKCLMIGNDRQTDIAGGAAAGFATLYMHTSLTPPDQAAADRSLSPEHFIETRQHYEYEGSDWQELAKLLCALPGSLEAPGR